jgi:hypothetical protein
MEISRVTLIIAVLLLGFLVSTSNGFANISAVQEKLREVQLKLIGEKIKLLQQQISDVGKAKPAESKPEPELSKEELSARIENQIKGLEAVIKDLKPRIIEEETARLEKEIARIYLETRTATGERLRELQDELSAVFIDYGKLNEQVKESLQVSLQQRQALVLQEQLKVLKAKVGAIPRGTPAPVPVAEPAAKKNFEVIQMELEKVKLKLLQTQAKAIQENIDKLRAK